MLLTARKFLQSKVIDGGNNLRGLLSNFGMKVLVAVARRLATILQRIWIDKTEYRWQAQSAR